MTRFDSFFQDQMLKVESIKEYDKNQLLFFLSQIEMK